MKKDSKSFMNALKHSIQSTIHFLKCMKRNWKTSKISVKWQKSQEVCDEWLKRKIDRKGFLDKFELLEFLQEIGLVNEKINTLTKFTTKSGFLEARLSTKENIVNYIENYVKKVYGSLHKEMNYEFRNTYLIYEKEFQPIELSVVLDNILNNSKKKGAKKVIFNFEKENETLILSIKDIGKPLDNSISKELIFEEGVTSTKGAGLGLSHVKRILEKDFNASIEYNPNYIDGFELIITFKKWN